MIKVQHSLHRRALYMHERARDYKKDFQGYLNNHRDNHRDAEREQVEMDNFQNPEVRLLF